MANFIGQGVFRCSHPIPILATAAIAGEKEGQGPMSACFDRICSDSYFGQTTWEQAEGALQRETVSLAIEKACLQPEQLDGILAGDLVRSSFFGHLWSVFHHVRRVTAGIALSRQRSRQTFYCCNFLSFQHRRTTISLSALLRSTTNPNSTMDMHRLRSSGFSCNC